MGFPAWHLHLDVWVVLGSVVAGYLVACRRHLAATGEMTPPDRRRLFLGGMLVLAVASSWPVHDIAEQRLFLVHMTQHLLYTLVAAPLLVTGVPPWMWRVALGPTAAKVVWRTLTRPVVAFVVFNGVLLFTHWPAVVNASVGSEATHFAIHVLVVASAIVMWWPVVSPLVEMPALSPPGQILYLFLQSLAPTIPASFLTFGSSPLYEAYVAFPRLWGLDPLTDQLVAGLIMKLAGASLLWGVITAVFFRWGNREQRDGWDALALRNVDAEIRSEMTR